jgi:anti-sigma28 factor (negative regulator of flagellin synthesis)
MRIDPKVITTPVATETRETPTRARPRSNTGGRASVVTLTAAGAALTEPARPSITTRLATIKAMVDAGDYPVDLDKLAERIIDDDMLRSAK